jgi:hypothetical protein
LYTPEKKIAKCYIHHDGDEKNKCEFTDRRLIVIRKGKVNEFAIENLKSVETNQRKLLIHIIFSGIFTPLILVGFFKGLFHPLSALIFIIGGVFLFYLGWVGEKVLTINLVKAHRDFSISILTHQLIAFIDYINQYITEEPIYKRVIYLEVESGEGDVHGLKSYLAGDNEKRKIYSYWQLRNLYLRRNLTHGKSYVMLDPISAGTEVKYMIIPGEQGLTPVIKGPINQKAIKRIIHYSEISSIIE